LRPWEARPGGGDTLPGYQEQQNQIDMASKETKKAIAIILADAAAFGFIVPICLLWIKSMKEAGTSAIAIGGAVSLTIVVIALFIGIFFHGMSKLD
jgi:hypothetical protein